MADLIRWDELPQGILAGYVGENPACLLEIYPPDARDGEWVLQSFLLGQAGKVRYGTSADVLKGRAEELLREFASSVGAVFPESVTPLTAGSTRCDSSAPNEDDELIQCPEQSRYAVIRSDRDPSYDVTCERAETEACEAHLAETVTGLMDGDDKMTVIVQVRWDA